MPDNDSEKHRWSNMLVRQEEVQSYWNYDVQGADKYLRSPNIANIVRVEGNLSTAGR